ncbi:GLIPR1-like protein 1 [Apostichopus japonicus]|uniref:GLIPR1-like protein 1 n=1 Tax=Stichopus japonicus TaxID=307972 RepID=UPI003AB7F66E
MNFLLILATVFSLSYAAYSDLEKEAMLDAHNYYRGNVEPEASSMAEMVWDDHLAQLAQEWASGCVFTHPKKNPDYKGVGQNLFLTTRRGTPTDVVVRAWYNEVQHYDYDTKTCAEENICGHYTQIVWAISKNVGCGVELCPILISETREYTNAWIVACNYSPGGNHRGALPYVAGNTCSACNPGENCRNGLCTPCDLSESDCDCKRQCQHCGTLDPKDCSCSCPDGYFGPACESFCEDTNRKCRANPGWPVRMCGRENYVQTKCPLMCNMCKEGPRDPVC